MYIYKKILIIFVILLVLKYFFVKKIDCKPNRPNKHKKPKKSWLFLVNGKNATITKKKIILDLRHNIVGFTDRPYHEINQLNYKEATKIAKWVSTTRDKPNATIIAISSNDLITPLSAVIEMSSMKFKNTLDRSNSKQIIIDYKVLSGSVGNIFPVKYEYISITIDNFAGTLYSLVKKGCNTIVGKLAKNVINASSSVAVCGELCPAVASAIVLAGGGPEDIFGDGVAAEFLVPCVETCPNLMNLAWYAYRKAANSAKIANKTIPVPSDIISSQVCDGLFPDSNTDLPDLPDYTKVNNTTGICNECCTRAGDCSYSSSTHDRRSAKTEKECLEAKGVWKKTYGVWNKSKITDYFGCVNAARKFGKKIPLIKNNPDLPGGCIFSGEDVHFNTEISSTKKPFPDNWGSDTGALCVPSNYIKVKNTLNQYKLFQFADT